MSNPRGWTRTTADYERFGDKEKLETGDTAARFSHEVGKVKKRPRDNKAPKESNNKLWFKKLEPDRETAQREVFAQELFRVFIPSHPKTRLALDEQGRTYVLSQGVPGYQSLEDINIAWQNTGVNGKAKLNQFLADTSELPVGAPKIKGMGDVMVMSLLMNEIDLKLGNMGVDSNGRVVKIDGDWCFANLRQYNGDYKITPELIAGLPNPGSYQAFNWLDAVQGDQVNPNPMIVGVGKMQEFRQEVNAALLRAILMPDMAIFRMASHHMQTGLVTDCCREMIDRKNQLRAAAIANPSFQAFMASPEAEKVKNEFQQHLDNFTMTGKEYLVMDQQLAHDMMDQTFGDVMKRTADLQQNARTELLVNALKNLLNNHADYYQSSAISKSKTVNKYIEILDSDSSNDEKLRQISELATNAELKRVKAIGLVKLIKYSGKRDVISELHVLLKNINTGVQQNTVLDTINSKNDKLNNYKRDIASRDAKVHQALEDSFPFIQKPGGN